MGNMPPSILQPTFSVFSLQAVFPSDFTEAKHLTVQQVEFTNTFDIYYSRCVTKNHCSLFSVERMQQTMRGTGIALLELMARSDRSLH